MFGGGFGGPFGFSIPLDLPGLELGPIVGKAPVVCGDKSRQIIGKSGRDATLVKLPNAQTPPKPTQTCDQNRHNYNQKNECAFHVLCPIVLFPTFTSGDRQNLPISERQLPIEFTIPPSPGAVYTFFKDIGGIWKRTRRRDPPSSERYGVTRAPGHLRNNQAL